MKDLATRFADNLPISSAFALSWTARRFRYRVIAKKGGSDKLRLRDRPSIGGIPLSTLAFRQQVVECLVEAIRSAVQTGFYVCDYTTKPNMTCAPLLTYLRDGMQHLSDQIEGDDHRKRFQDYLRKGLITTSTGDAAPSVRADEPSRKRAPIYSKYSQFFLYIFLTSAFLSRHLLLLFVIPSVSLDYYSFQAHIMFRPACLSSLIHRPVEPAEFAFTSVS